MDRSASGVYTPFSFFPPPHRQSTPPPVLFVFTSPPSEIGLAVERFPPSYQTFQGSYFLKPDHFLVHRSPRPSLEFSVLIAKEKGPARGVWWGGGWCVGLGCFFFGFFVGFGGGFCGCLCACTPTRPTPSQVRRCASPKTLISLPFPPFGCKEFLLGGFHDVRRRLLCRGGDGG